MSKNVKWVTLDNATGESTLRQHGFKPKTRRSRFSNGEYLSNVSPYFWATAKIEII